MFNNLYSGQNLVDEVRININAIPNKIHLIELFDEYESEIIRSITPIIILKKRSLFPIFLFIKNNFLMYFKYSKSI